jgi:catechol 2,3-dioxygenase
VIDPRTRVGAVELGVASIDRSLAFYDRAIGLAVLHHEAGRVTLGCAGTALVALVEVPGATPAPRATGLFHLALRVPDRASLARWLDHAGRERVQLQGLSDHFVSEAIYLADPDGHGIEIYHDRPRASWEGRLEQMTTLPLDVASLLSELTAPPGEPFRGLPSRTDMGHVHLQVRDVAEAVGFYRDVLGFELMAAYGAQAAFLAAGGYHHHVGVNTWNSLGASPPPEGAAALRHASILFPDESALTAVRRRLEDAGTQTEDRPDGLLVRDPSGVPLLLAVAVSVAA